MKYKFRFQKILDIKEKLEESKKMEINNLLSEVNKFKEEIYYLNKSKESKNIEIKSVMKLGTDINTIRSMNEFIYSIDLKIKMLIQKLDLLENELEVKKKEYIEVMKEKKTFEKLKERDIQNFNEKLKKQEEQFVDQIVTFKHSIGN
ncbi:flagellar export protein FliJ [Tepidibacter thalassicus]|uniref:Flagellar FliJ protein n=1 Tax=Tepidibacter thalassicus DSM 15285 TaxID=1123350 RepID=A0A1M5NT11_9FIRM|nr:flagellar export protein FliJ [Tepidibacter thalassicus]SHG92588.1 flagellar FliJ protein [Tepidibacter thalassicus DSM 15285]